ncbi:globin [Halobacteriovorax marinus]|uniref:Group 1 truncated hemoglobin n=1 Tax=Halobacteriovorax marinus TaxID=97084 RepID=A0A1Y5FAB6_9BACT|nr:globin [Halobacteriovorax marinus]
MAESLFEKYGGFSTLGKLVVEFYKKVLNDKTVAHFFEDVEMDKLMEHQTNFLAFALGGPNEYAGRDVKVAHEVMDISNRDFSIVAGYLEETLDEAGVEEADIATIISIVSGLQDQIVTKKAA